MKVSVGGWLAAVLVVLLVLSTEGLVWANEASTLPSTWNTSSTRLMFIQNVGQLNARVLFQVRGADRTIWLTEDGIWVTVVDHKDSSTLASERFNPLEGKSSRVEGNKPSGGVNIRLSFPGANPHPRLEPLGRLETQVSYFIGNDPTKWWTAVPVYAGVRYVDLYPGVDLEVTSEGGRWVWRLAFRGVSPKTIGLRVEGADAVEAFSSSLVLQTAVGEFTLPLIKVEQEDARELQSPNVQQINPQAFDVVSPVTTGPSVCYPLAQTRDASSDLLYATFLGGSSFYEATSIAVDGTGAAYVAGYTESPDFPTTAGAFDTTSNGGYDAFVVKLNPSGSGLLYSTFLGGSSSDWATSIAVDGTGVAYVAGETESSDFPTTAGAYDTTFNGDRDAFVVKLNPSGSGLLYSTFLGGKSDDRGYCIAVDATGAAYVAGSTHSSDFPTTPGAFDTTSVYTDGFVAKLNRSGSELLYATFLGGEYWDRVSVIAVDATGAAYVAGKTRSSDFPTTLGAFDTTFNGQSDTFVVKLSPSGSDLLYATFLGGSDGESTSGIAVDAAGAAYVVGYTYSSDFPTTAGAFDTTITGGDDPFVVKLNSSGSDLLYSTFLRGSPGFGIVGIAVDEAGAAYVAGCTGSPDFPTTPGAFDTTFNGWSDTFVVKLSPSGSDLLYATFLGGSDGESTSGIAVDAAGAAYVVGYTYSSDFPTTAGAYDTSYNGGDDAFVAKLALAGETGLVTGDVTDAHTGTGIADALVEVEGGGASTHTDANGHYELSLSDGDYHLRASADGYQSQEATVTVTAGHTAEVDFVLALFVASFTPVYPASDASPSKVVEKGTFYRYYKLVDQQGNPISGATVHLTNIGSEDGVTSDENGIVKLGGKAEALGPAGTYTDVDLVGRATLTGGQEIPTTQEPRFDVTVYPQSTVDDYNAGAGVELEAGGGLGVGVGALSVDIVSAAVTAGAGFSLGIEMERDTISLSRDFTAEVGGKVHLGPEVNAGVVSVEAGIGAEASYQGLGGQKFVITQPLDIHEKRALAAFVWEPLVASGALFFPGIGPLMGAMISAWSESEIEPYFHSSWWGTGLQCKVPAGVELEVNVGKGSGSSSTSITLGGFTQDILSGSLCEKHYSFYNESSREERETSCSLGLNLQPVRKAFSLFFPLDYLSLPDLDSLKSEFSTRSKTLSSGDLQEVKLSFAVTPYWEFNVPVVGVNTYSGYESVVKFTGQSLIQNKDLLPDIIKPFVYTSPLGPLAWTASAFSELAGSFQLLSLLSGLQGEKDIYRMKGRTFKFELGVKFSAGEGVDLKLGIGGKLTFASSRKQLMRRYILPAADSNYYLTEEYPNDIDLPDLSKPLSTIWDATLDALASVAADVFHAVQKTVEGAGKVVVETAKPIIEGGKELIASGADLMGWGIKSLVLAPINMLSSMNEEKMLKTLSVMPSDVARALYLQSKVYTNITTVGEASLVNALDEAGDQVKELPTSTLVMGYTLDQLQAVGLGAGDAGDLRIFRWDDGEKKWELIGGVVDRDEHSVTVGITRPGMYSLGVGACDSYSHELPTAGWHMTTLPGELCSSCEPWGSGEGGDLVCALSDDIDPCFIFHYDPGVGGYVMAPPSENIQYHAGMGFWVRTYEDSVAIDAEVQVATEAVEVPLGNGWNQIGNPFAFGVAADALKVRCGDTELSLTDAQAQGWVSAYLFGYDTASGGYVMIDPTTGCLQPWNGYWMRSYRDDCVLIVPPTECSASAPAGEPMSTKELQARGLELPPSPPNDLINLDVKEVLAGLTVRNVPNPIRSEHTTTFKVEGKGAELVQAIRVEIYNQAGQKLFTQDINATELEWHTNNDTGELLANGVYLYQVWVKVASQWYPTGVHKLAVVR